MIPILAPNIYCHVSVAHHGPSEVYAIEVEANDAIDRHIDGAATTPRDASEYAEDRSCMCQEVEVVVFRDNTGLCCEKHSESSPDIRSVHAEPEVLL
jgi:hypothetical protein